MDAAPFFAYPTAAAPAGGAVFLAAAGEEGWRTLLAHTETLRFSAGDVVIAAGDVDRALYLLTQGSVDALDGDRVVAGVAAPSVLGEVAFLDGGPRSLTLRATAPVELRRLTFEAFETLAARHPFLARDVLLEVGRIVAGRLRRASAVQP